MWISRSNGAPLHTKDPWGASGIPISSLKRLNSVVISCLMFYVTVSKKRKSICFVFGGFANPLY